MFESAELGHKITKATYDAEVPALREALLAAQFDLSQKGKSAVIILVGGVDGAGKGETVNLLNAWMDPRHIEVHVMGDTPETLQYPHMWRYWRALPPKGKIGMFFGSWYTPPIVQRVLGKSKLVELNQCIHDINQFEKMLTNEGALIIKFWFHLSKEAQRVRLNNLEKDPKTRWRVTELDWQRFKLYNKFRKVSEHTLRMTSTAEAPWIVIEGTDPRYRSLTAGRILLQAMQKRMEQTELASLLVAPPLQVPIDHLDLFDRLDMAQTINDKKFAKELEKYQGKLNLLTRDPLFSQLSVITVFEGADAAGKGGAIRRITGALDARHYRIVPVAAPTEEERAQPYLWRFWRHIPATSGMTIFDRSWYGRVLVERVEKYCSEADWMRAYSEINDFEEQLVNHNTVLVKFWLTISKEEQLRRFQEREKIGFKRFKITEEDWRNREKWDDYEIAVCDMVDRTSTEIAPWTLVEANDKNFARIKVIKTLCQRIETALEKLKRQA
ncbi:MAG: polyphosphate:AMP phosphotransferase [Gallionella sp.]|nr:polyphosphate:AMP phosphotransferase [Gallionella sp.]